MNVVLMIAISCTKMAEPMDMPFGLWTPIDPRKDVLHGGGHIGATWRIRLNRPCAAAVRPFSLITLRTCSNLKSSFTRSKDKPVNQSLKKLKWPK